jgi:hypothetical protein
LRLIQRAKGFGAVAPLLLGIASPALAQPDPAAPSNDRPRAAPITQPISKPDTAVVDTAQDTVDAFAPKGIEILSFILLPKFEIDDAYNTNIFAATFSKKSDFIYRLGPEIALRSRFTQHELNLLFQVNDYIHQRYKSDNHVDIFVNSDGRFDFSKTTEAGGRIGFSRGAEDRSSPDAANGIHPTDTQSLNSSLSLKTHQGNYRFGTTFNFDRYTYSDALKSDGTYVLSHLRDRNQIDGSVRASYELYPGYEAVGQATGNTRRYDNKKDLGGYDRSSDGYRLESGIGLDLSQVIRGDFLLGYTNQSYDDSRLKSIQGFSYRANFNWTPSRMTLVTPYFERTTQETTTANSSGLDEFTGGFTIRHELERNILLFGAFSATRDRYQGIGEHSLSFNVKGRITYVLRPELYMALESEYRNRTFNFAQPGFVNFNQFIVTLRLGTRI